MTSRSHWLRKNAFFYVREMEDGFLLHRVSFSEFVSSFFYKFFLLLRYVSKTKVKNVFFVDHKQVTYTINLSGQVIDTRLVKQKGKEAI